MSGWRRLLARMRGLLVAVLTVCGLLVLYDETPLGALGRMAVNSILGTSYKGPSPLASFSDRGGRSYGFLLPVDERAVLSVQAAASCMPSETIHRIAEVNRVNPATLAALVGAYASASDDGECSIHLESRLASRAIELLPGGTSHEAMRTNPDLAARGLGRLLASEHKHFANQPLQWELAVESLLLGREAVKSAVAAAQASGLAHPTSFDSHRSLLPTGDSDRADRAVWVLTRVRLSEMLWPSNKNFRMTSPFGDRIHPVLGTKRFHNGVDIAMPVGTELQAILNGDVKRQSYDNVSGNYVRISHGLGIVSIYCHLDRAVASQGQSVHQGQLVALSGNTGRSTGPHLHYTMKLYGRAVDPVALFGGSIKGKKGVIATPKEP